MAVAPRYEANIGSFSEEELCRAKQAKAAIVGIGGLGGYVANALARFGVGTLTLIDGDSFTEKNLNRQLFATSATLGANKALAAQGVLAHINPETECAAHPVMLAKHNALGLLAGHQIIVDCLDDIPSRRLLGQACATLGIPFVHGAISGLYGQVACQFPDNDLMGILYPENIDDTPSKTLGNPVFAPQLVAAIQAYEAVGFLVGRESVLHGAVLFIDMITYDFEVTRFPDL